LLFFEKQSGSNLEFTLKIGFANIFSFRPHVEHLFYLSELMKNSGHEVYFLTCDSSVSDCFSKKSNYPIRKTD